MYLQPSAPLRTLFALLTFLPTHALVLPCTALYHSIRYLLIPSARRFPRLPWYRYVLLNVQRVRGEWTRGWCVAARDPRAADRIPSKYDGACDVAAVTVPPWEGEEGERIEVLDSEVVPAGVVRAVEVPAFWVRAKGGEKAHASAPDAPAKPDERVIFFIVGGGYAHGHPLEPHTAFSFAKLTRARVFGLNYRKSLDDASAFPAVLLDCLAGWAYLRDQGFEAKRNIVLAGDSAGANAALALTRYLDALRQLGADHDYGLPRGLALFSPWSDMTASFPSLQRNRYTDSIGDLTRVHIPSHTRHFPDRANPYFSPALPANTADGHFARLGEAGTRAYVLAGTAEGMHDEIVALKDGMRGAGMDVTFRHIEGASHSDFVWMDRPGWRGWSWRVVRNDFENFWYATDPVVQ